jgi:hypothetical protein
VGMSKLFMNEVSVKLPLKNTIYASEILGIMTNYLDAMATWYQGFVLVLV